MNPVCEAAAMSMSGKRALPVRAQIVLGACACAGASAFLFAVDPSRHAVYPQCLFYRTTGFYCAGCGATRALYALLHGRILEALHDNALFVAALPLVLALAVFYVAQSWRVRAWPASRLEPRILARSGTWIFFTMVLFMAVRNLPGPHFDFLKPLAG